MTAKDLYNHITKHMTPEEALMKLLEGTIRTYEHLKFDKENDEEVHPVMIIATASLDMGWNIAIPNNDVNDELSGMIVGTEEYIDNILDSETSDDQN